MKKKIPTLNDIRMRDTQHSDSCWWWLASLFMAAMLAVMAATAVSCTEEPIAKKGQQEEEGLPATIRLEVLPDRAEQVQTRVAEKDESAIKDLHVLVYNSAGELIGQSYAVYNASEPAFTVKTRSGSNNKIYAIANTGDSALFDGTVAATETKLNAMKTSALTKWDGLTTVSHLLMVGKKTNLTIVAGSSTLQGGMTVERVTAKVKLNIEVETNSGITITGCRVFSLPKQSYYVPNTTTDAATTWVSDSTSTAINNATSVEKTFFMYENRRGENKNIEVQKDKGGSKAKANATYVVINGTATGYNATWTVYLGGNNTSDFNIKRNGKYTYNITLKRPGTDGTDTRVSVEEAFADGTANCYILNKIGDSVDIPVDRANLSDIAIDGSEKNATTGTYIQLEKETEWTTEIVWRDSACIEVTKSSGKGYADYFTVKATKKSGNAVVAIKNNADNILWSWHIWVTPEPIAVSFKNGFQLMDRNLGATSSTIGNLNSCGLYYQWGRKDPFTSSASKAAVPANTTNNLTNAIRNPNTFYTNGSTNGNWMESVATTNYNNLWSNKVFDPCPAGWRVANWTGKFDGPINTEITGWEKDKPPYGTVFCGNFVVAGGRLSGADGGVSDIGNSIYIYSAASNGMNGICYHAEYKGGDWAYPSYNLPKAYGLSVRCCK